MTRQRDEAIKRCRERIEMCNLRISMSHCDAWNVIEHYRIARQFEQGKLEQLIADARAAAPSTIMPREVGERSTEHFVVVGDHTPEPRVAHEPYHPLIGGSI